MEVRGRHDGGAQWLFDRIELPGDAWYSYSDLHRSDGRSRILLSCMRAAGGSVSYRVIAQSGASAEWHREEVRFYLGPSADCEASVLHAVDRDGFLEIARPTLRRAPPAPLARPLVSLAFDDGFKSAVTTAREDLETRGFAASYYLVKKFIDDPGGHYATTADLRALVASAAARGHEIASHTAHHPFLTGMSPRARRREMKAGLSWLSRLGIAPAGLAYPLGDFDAATEADARRFHPYARTSLDGLNDASTNRYRIKVETVTADTDTTAILDRIDDAVRTSTWLVLLFHDIGGPAPPDPYLTPRAQYLAVLDRLGRGDAAVVTVAEALRQIAGQAGSR